MDLAVLQEPCFDRLELFWPSQILILDVIFQVYQKSLVGLEYPDTWLGLLLATVMARGRARIDGSYAHYSLQSLAELAGCAEKTSGD